MGTKVGGVEGPDPGVVPAIQDARPNCWRAPTQGSAVVDQRPAAIRFEVVEIEQHARESVGELRREALLVGDRSPCSIGPTEHSVSPTSRTSHVGTGWPSAAKSSPILASER